MSKLFLRVSSQWAKLFDPQETDTFLINVTGTPIQFKYYDTERLPNSTFAHTFTLGGTIGQARIPKGKYCYARACLRILADGSYIDDEVIDSTEQGDTSFIDPEGIIVADDNRMNTASSELESLREQVEHLTVGVMHLSSKVSEQKIAATYHYWDYMHLMRQFLRAEHRTHYQLSYLQSQILSDKMSIFDIKSDIGSLKNQHAVDREITNQKLFATENTLKELTAQDTSFTENINSLRNDQDELRDQFLKNAQEDHYQLSYLQSQILDLRMKLFSAEDLVLALKESYSHLALSIGELPFQGNVSERIQELEVSINVILGQTNSVLKQLTELEERLESGEFGDGSGGSGTVIPDEDLQQIKDELSSLHTDFTSLNNGLVILSSKYTVDDVDAALADLEPTLSAAIKEPVGAIRDVLIRLIEVTDQYDNTIKKDDTVVLEGSSDMLGTL